MTACTCIRTNGNTYGGGTRRTSTMYFHMGMYILNVMKLKLKSEKKINYCSSSTIPFGFFWKDLWYGLEKN